MRSIEWALIQESDWCPHQFSSVQLLSHIQLFATPWITARQASLSIINSWSSLRLMSIESVMPSNHLILSSPSPPAPNPSQHRSLFQWVNSSHEVATVLEFQLQHHSLQRNPRADLLQNGLVGSPCSPGKKRKLGHMHTEVRACEEAGRRQPPTSQGERPQKKPTLSTPWSETSSL